MKSKKMRMTKPRIEGVSHVEAEVGAVVAFPLLRRNRHVVWLGVGRGALPVANWGMHAGVHARVRLLRTIVRKVCDRRRR